MQGLIDREEVYKALMGLLRFEDIVGFSLKPRVVDGEKIVRIYVSQLTLAGGISIRDILPEYIGDYRVDLYETGRIDALGLYTVKPASKPAKTSVVRPLRAGVSIGHVNITAGTLGYFFKDRDGDILLGSNAHVFTDDPFKEPREIVERRITQPGPYDIGSGDKLDYVVAEYTWHSKLYMVMEESRCSIARGLSRVYNALSRVLGRKSRLVPVVSEYNRIDFAVAKPLVGHTEEIIDTDIDRRGLFAGVLFAGSPKVSVFGKARYIEEAGYKPLRPAIHDLIDGMTVEKSGRTTCHTRGKIIDSSAVVRVYYGAGRFALFKDVVITDMPADGGDSGSSVWYTG